MCGFIKGLDMPYEVSSDQDNKMVIARVSGPVTREEHRAAREEALKLCSDLGFKRLLVDLHDLKTENIVTSESAFSFGKDTARDERTKEICIAHVMPKEVLARLDVQYAASSSEIHGKAIGEFGTFVEAKEWLLR